MAAYDIRIIGDPVLREVATDVTDIDGALVKVAEGMVDAMYRADGLAVAAPQVGVRKRVVVYHLPDDPEPLTIVNPRIEEYGDDEWVYSEGCLSIPGLYWEIARPKTVHVVGLDLDGVLMTERLDDDQRAEAKKAVRELMLARGDQAVADGPGSLLP